jgi:hypothetical protein
MHVSVNAHILNDERFRFDGCLEALRASPRHISELLFVFSKERVGTSHDVLNSNPRSFSNEHEILE